MSNKNQELSTPENNVSIKKELLEWFRAFIVAVVFFLILNIFLFPAKVDGNSMYPNYEDGDRLLVSRLAYKTDLPSYGDVVIFYCDTKGFTLIKRVIGLPGDQIEIKDGNVYRNGSKLDESSYINVDTVGEINTIVEDGHIFVLGDNRPDSADSRYAEVGQVDMRNVKGKVLFRVFPHTGKVK